jgi:hypothetical protein
MEHLLLLAQLYDSLSKLWVSHLQRTHFYSFLLLFILLSSPLVSSRHYFPLAYLLTFPLTSILAFSIFSLVKRLVAEVVAQPFLFMFYGLVLAFLSPNPR